MGDISNSVLLDEIDHMTAVSKSQAAAYTSTVDCFDIMVREQNPDDLIAGVTAAETTDDKLDGGTNNYSQWNLMLSWLGTRATAAGSTDLLDLLADRHLRVPADFDSYIWYPARNAHVAGARLFLSATQTMGQYLHEGTAFSSGNAIPSTVLYTECSCSVGTGQLSGAAAWSVSANVTYANASTGTEYIDLTPYATMASPAITVGKVAVAAGSSVKASLAGGTDINMTPTGMVAGQYVLLKDHTLPALLTADTDTSATVTIAPNQAGWYTPGDVLYIRDDTTTDEEVTIEQINYETGVITLTAATSGSFYTSLNGFIRLKTAGTKGWSEVLPIASVAATKIVASGALQHSYYSGGYAVRLIKNVFGMATTHGGTNGDHVKFNGVPERTISQT